MVPAKHSFDLELLDAQEAVIVIVCPRFSHSS